MEEVLMVPPKEMEKLIRYYKGELTENAWLNKAARTAAKRDLLLKSQIPAGIIKAKVKPLSRELHHLTKRVRHGPVGGLGGQLEDEEDEEDDSLVTGPMEQVVEKRHSEGDRQGSEERNQNTHSRVYLQECHTLFRSRQECHSQVLFVHPLVRTSQANRGVPTKSQSQTTDRTRKVENGARLVDLGQTRQT